MCASAADAAPIRIFLFDAHFALAYPAGCEVQVSPWPIDKQLAPANVCPVVGVWAFARMVASDAKAVLRRGQRSACSCPGYGACAFEREPLRAAGPDL